MIRLMRDICSMLIPNIKYIKNMRISPKRMIYSIRTEQLWFVGQQILNLRYFCLNISLNKFTSP
jgi:hypothetical protein